MATVFKIYYTHPENPAAQFVDCNNLSDALQMSETLRKKGMIFVTIVSENTDLVGKMGVDSIVDGKTPDGEVYDWSKAGRAGKVKRSERTMSALQGTDNIEVPLE